MSLLETGFPHTIVRLSQAAILEYANLLYLCGYEFYFFCQTFNLHSSLENVKGWDSVHFSLKFLQ